MTEIDGQRAKYIGICMAKDTIHMNNSKSHRALGKALTAMGFGKGWWVPIGDAFKEARKEMIRRDKRDK